MMETIEEQLKSNFYNNPAIKKLLKQNKLDVATNVKSPFTAATELLKTYFK